MKNIFRFLSPILLICGIVQHSYAVPISGSIFVGGGNPLYLDLASTIQELNNNGISGNVTVYIQTPQTAPTGGYVLGSTLLNSTLGSASTLTFSGGGNIVTAGVGTNNPGANLNAPGSNPQDGIFTIIGADYVTIDGLNLMESPLNITNTTRMEYGYGLFNLNNAHPYDGTQHVTIKNCTITLSPLNPISKGIFSDHRIVFSGAVSGTTNLSSDDANSYNTFTNDSLISCSGGIVLGGANLSGVYDYNNAVGTATAGNVFVCGGSNISIIYGVVTGNDSVTTVMNNKFYLKSGQSGGNIVFVGTSLISGFVAGRENLNIIQNNFDITSSASITGMYCYYNSGHNDPSATFNFNNNTLTGTGICNALYFLYYATAATFNTANINNNIASNLNLTTSSGLFAGINFVTASSITNLNCNNNSFSNISRTSTGGITTPINLQNGNAVSGTVNCNNNKFRNITVANELSFKLISGNVSGITPTQSLNYKNNVFDILDLSAGTGNFIAYTQFGISPDISNDTFTNINLGGATGSFNTASNGLGTLASNPNIAFNYFNNISTNGGDFVNTLAYNAVAGTIHDNIISTVSTKTGKIYGINYTAGGAVAIPVINNNNINNLSVTGTGSNPVYGMYITGLNNVIVNNNFIINLQAASSSSPSLYGIYLLNSGYKDKVFFNTIQMPSSSATGGFSATGVYYGSVATLELLNNIININTQPGSTGNTVVVRASSGTVNIAPTNFVANGNIYYAPVAANCYLYGEGVASIINGFNTGGITANTGSNIVLDPGFNNSYCSKYKIFMNPYETATFTENNLVAGVTPNTFVPSNTIPTPAKTGAVATSPAVSTDYNYNTRANPADIGALQFSGSYLDLAAPTITYTPFPAKAYCSSTPQLCTTITDVSGVNVTTGLKPRLYYRKVAGTGPFEANAFGTNNTSTGSQWKWVEPQIISGNSYCFNMDYTLLRNPTLTNNDSIQYFVIAQDLSPAVNVAFVKAGMSICPSSVNLISPDTMTPTPKVNGFKYTPGTLTLSATATPATFCTGGSSTTLTLTPDPGAGTTIVWYDTSRAIVDSAHNVSLTIPISNADTFNVKVYCSGTLISTIKNIRINIFNPLIDSVKGGTHCGIGVDSLVAYSHGSWINWYSNATGGLLQSDSVQISTNPRIIRSVFYTPTLNSTKNYYVGASVLQQDTVYKINAATANTGTAHLGGIMFTITPTKDIFIDTFNTLFSTPGLNAYSVYFYNGNYNTAVPAITTNSAAWGTPVAAGNVITTAGVQKAIDLTSANIPLLLAGQTYSFCIAGGLTLTTTGATYTNNSLSTVFGTGLANGPFAGPFSPRAMNGSIVYHRGCVGNLQPVQALITPPPAFTVISPQSPGNCTGMLDSVIVNSAPPSGNSNYTFTYTTSPVTPVTVISGTPPLKYYTFTPTVSPTKIVVTATDLTNGSYAGCKAMDSLSFLVSPQPTPPIVTPLSQSICIGQAGLLSAVSNYFIPNNITIGTGTSTNLSTAYPCPIGNWYTGQRHQQIYTPAELTAQGLLAGSTITCLTFNVQALNGCAALHNFTMYIGHASQTAFTVNNWASGLNQIFFSSNYTPLLGINNFTFSTPFVWNGTQSIVVETIFNQPTPVTYTNNTSIYNTPTSFNSVIYSISDAYNSVAGIYNYSLTSSTVLSIRPNIQFCATKPITDINWLNITGLYSNSTLTNPVNYNTIIPTVYCSPSLPGTYTYQAVVNYNGCKSIPSTPPDTVRVNPLPNVTISSVSVLTGGSASSTCEGDTIKVTLPLLTNPLPLSNYTYSWRNASNIVISTNNYLYVTASGTFTVKVTNNLTGCFNTNTFTIIVNPLPPHIISANGPTTVCSGCVTLFANSSAYQYQWYKNSYNAAGLIAGATSNSYIACTNGDSFAVAVSSPTCTSLSNWIKITVIQTTSNISASGTTNFCTGYRVTLCGPTYPVAVPADTVKYQWQFNGVNIPSAAPYEGDSSCFTTLLTGLYSTSGHYTLIVTHIKNGVACIDSSSVNVNVGAPPIASFTPYHPTDTIHACTGDTVNLIGNCASNVTNKWYKNGLAVANVVATTCSLKVWSPSATYYQYVYQAVGCDSTSRGVYVYFHPKPTANVTNTALNVCQNDTVKFTANAGTNYKYQWYKKWHFSCEYHNGSYWSKIQYNYSGYLLCKSIRFYLSFRLFNLLYCVSCCNLYITYPQHYGFK